MKLTSLEVFELHIPFRAAFTHASAERAMTETVWVKAGSDAGVVGFGEGCPRVYVTGETLETAQRFFSKHRAAWLEMEWSFSVLVDWAAGHRAEIDANPAAWCAVELALLDLIGKAQQQSVEALFGLPELTGKRVYTAVLGASEPAKFRAQLAYYQKAGFRDYKIKLAGDRPRNGEVVKSLADAGVSPSHARADANNLWPNARVALAELQSLNFPWNAVEEPLPPGRVDEMRTLAQAFGSKIILDESMLRAEQLRVLAADAKRWILNVRVSKMGGLVRTLELLGEAKRHGIRVIVGAHVGESSVLTRAALTAASAARDVLVAQEGAFGTHLLARDVVDDSLMFGAGGVLQMEQTGISGASGFGLTIAADLPLRAL
jgi:L-alanine-DL-glutamate epimerase-like enolase superfamily enzyme